MLVTTETYSAFTAYSANCSQLAFAMMWSFET